MKLVSYRAGGAAHFGIVNGEGVVALGSRTGASSLRGLLLEGGLKRAAEFANEKPDHKLSEIEYLPVIPDAAKIVCIGVNYQDHAAEMGRGTVPDYPTVFTRFADSQVGHNQPIARPRRSEQMDYECELAVVIGKAGRDIPESAAFDYVAGYSCYNDVSIRDYQRHTSQFVPGKNFTGCGAFGPFLVTADEVGKLGPQRIQTRLNGAVVQNARLDQMVFNVPKLIAYISEWSALAPGDVIITGTPAGVGAARKPPLWMKPGDTVEVEIDGVGVLANKITA